MTDSHKKPVRNYLQRREQWRLLSLVLGLGLVVVVMNEVRKPKNWGWFAALCREDSSPQQPTGDSLSTVAAEEDPESTEGAIHAGGKRAVPKAPALKGVFRLTREQKETIEDDTTWLWKENKAWFRLLRILRQNDESVLKQRSEGPASYTQLYAQSKEYRGRLVTLEGIVRRVHPLTAPPEQISWWEFLTAPENDRFEKYWQLWLFPTDNPGSPIVVYCLDLPKGFPTGMDLEESVELTGFFFKRWAINAHNAHTGKDSSSIVPTVLTKSVQWHPARLFPQGNTMEINARFFITIIAVAAVVSFFLVVYVYQKTRRRPSAAQETPVNLDALLSAETLSENGAAPEPQPGED